MDHQDWSILDTLAQWNALVWREERETGTQRQYTFRNMAEQYDRIREALALWSYRVVDHHNIDRSPVATAFAYFDLLLSKGMI